jgi:hypothetical protein
LPPDWKRHHEEALRYEAAVQQLKKGAEVEGGGSEWGGVSKAQHAKAIGHAKGKADPEISRLKDD